MQVTEVAFHHILGFLGSNLGPDTGHLCWTFIQFNAVMSKLLRVLLNKP